MIIFPQGCIQAARRICVAGLMTFMALAPLESIAAPPAAIADEYQVKAVFLFNFAQFVEWPADAFVSNQAPIVIGLYGNDPFGPYLDELVKGEHVGGRPLLIHRYEGLQDVADCHILFICRSGAGDIKHVIGQLQARSILTISDADTFTREGGMVRFATENGKIRLKINVEIARAHRLAISSKILRPATIVTAEGD